MPLFTSPSFRRLFLSYLLLIRPLRRAIGPVLGSGIGIATTLRSLAVGLGFIGAEIVLLQRLTLVLSGGKVEKVFYPVFPPDKHAEEVIAWLARNSPAEK